MSLLGACLACFGQAPGTGAWHPDELRSRSAGSRVAQSRAPRLSPGQPVALLCQSILSRLCADKPRTSDPGDSERAPGGGREETSLSAPPGFPPVAPPRFPAFPCSQRTREMFQWGLCRARKTKLGGKGLLITRWDFKTPLFSATLRSNVLLVLADVQPGWGQPPPLQLSPPASPALSWQGKGSPTDTR